MTRHNNLYILNKVHVHTSSYNFTHPNTCNSASFQHFDHVDSTLWHYRLEHPSTKVLHKMSQKFSIINYNKNSLFHTCHLAKQCRLPFPISTSVSSHCFDLVHMDIWGPIFIPSLDGFQYFLTIFDDFTRYTWTFLMTHKFETRLHIKNFITYYQTQFSCKIKIIRNDNGTEFLMASYYVSLGILHQ